MRIFVNLKQSLYTSSAIIVSVSMLYTEVNCMETTASLLQVHNTSREQEEDDQAAQFFLRLIRCCKSPSGLLSIEDQCKAIELKRTIETIDDQFSKLEESFLGDQPQTRDQISEDLDRRILLITLKDSLKKAALDQAHSHIFLEQNEKFTAFKTTLLCSFLFSSVMIIKHYPTEFTTSVAIPVIGGTMLMLIKIVQICLDFTTRERTNAIKKKATDKND